MILAVPIGMLFLNLYEFGAFDSLIYLSLIHIFPPWREDWIPCVWRLQIV